MTRGSKTMTTAKEVPVRRRQCLSLYAAASAALLLVASIRTTDAFSSMLHPARPGLHPQQLLSSRANFCVGNSRKGSIAVRSVLSDDSGAPQRASSSTATTPRPASSLKTRTKTKRSKRKKNKTKKHKQSQELQDQKLQEDLMYIYGPNGILHQSKAKKSGRSPSSSPSNNSPRTTTTSSTNNAPNNHKMLDRHPALVLNADYQPMTYLPLSRWNWQEAIKAVFTGKVTVVDVYPDVFVRAANLEIPLPSVIALNEYVPQQYKQQNTPAFTKRNVFLRDEYRCQYCSDRFHDTRDLSIDHVKPRCMGGQLHWENAVTSCHPCNRRKGCLRVTELRSVGMRLLREPRAPTQFELAAIAGRMIPSKQVHPTWEPFLGLASVMASSSGNHNNHQALSSSNEASSSS